MTPPPLLITRAPLGPRLKHTLQQRPLPCASANRANSDRRSHTAVSLPWDGLARTRVRPQPQAGGPVLSPPRKLLAGSGQANIATTLAGRSPMSAMLLSHKPSEHPSLNQPFSRSPLCPSFVVCATPIVWRVEIGHWRPKALPSWDPHRPGHGEASLRSCNRKRNFLRLQAAR